MPIGLLDATAGGGRRCDAEARRLAGIPSAIFSPPIRPMLRARSYAEARAIASLSRQSYGLLKKIAEVDALMTPSLQDRVFETHPEVAFAELSGQRIWWSKKSRDGRAARLDALAMVVPEIERISRVRKRHLHVDDVLDACVSALVAARHRLGLARRVPRDPPRDARGLRMEIWY